MNAYNLGNGKRRYSPQLPPSRYPYGPPRKPSIFSWRILGFYGGCAVAYVILALVIWWYVAE